MRPFQGLPVATWVLRKCDRHAGKPGVRMSGGNTMLPPDIPTLSDIAEIKLRAERRLGDMLREAEKHPPGPVPQDRSHDVTDPPTLSDIGVSKMQSSRWQKVARLPDEVFEEHVEAMKDAGACVALRGLILSVWGRARWRWIPVEWFAPAAVARGQGVDCGSVTTIRLQWRHICGEKYAAAVARRDGDSTVDCHSGMTIGLHWRHTCTLPPAPALNLPIMGYDRSRQKKYAGGGRTPRRATPKE
ncbi:hypothetical protein BH23CHL2_BH23CHL2_25030 [soil metagenome]